MLGESHSKHCGVDSGMQSLTEQIKRRSRKES